MTDGYPAQRDVDYPVQLDVEYPDRPLNRLTTFFRAFTIIPIAIVLGTVSGAEDAPASDADDEVEQLARVAAGDQDREPGDHDAHQRGDAEEHEHWWSRLRRCLTPSPARRQARWRLPHSSPRVYVRS